MSEIPNTRPGKAYPPSEANPTSHTRDPGLRVAELRSYPPFLALHEAWNRLAEMTPMQSVFLRHEWFDAVWQWPQPRARPLILLFYENDALIGILPLVLQQTTFYGLPLRNLAPLQTPDTQEFGLLADLEKRGSVAAAFAHWLNRERKRWDQLDLTVLPQRSGDRDCLLEGLRGGGIQAEPQADQLNLSINVEQPWETYYGSLSRRLKKSNNWIRNRLEHSNHVELQQHRTADTHAKPLERAIAISGRSWKAELELSLDFPGPRAFIERLTAHAAQQGWLSLWLLEWNNEAVAMEYQLVFQGRVHALRGDFDPDYEALSPGAYLHHQQLRALFSEEGTHTYLMGPGPNPYKQRWSQEGETLQALRGWSPTWRGLAIRAAQHRLLPLARRIRAAWLARWRGKAQ